MYRPNARQLRRIAVQAAAIAVVEAGIDHLETAATNAGLHSLAIALNLTAASPPPPLLPPWTATPSDPIATAQITATASLSSPVTTTPAPHTGTSRIAA
jgi:hypothetical protein